MTEWSGEDRASRTTSLSGGGPRPADQPQPRQRSRRTLLVGVAGGAIALAVGVVLGLQVAHWWVTDDEAALAEAQDRLARAQAALSVAQDRNWKYYRENQALEEQLARAQGGGGLPPEVPGGDGVLQEGVYADGVYVIGEDIEPGTYDGTVVARTGYWARLKNTTGMIDGIIANAIVRGPFVLTVNESDVAVELQGVRLTPR